MKTTISYEDAHQAADEVATKFGEEGWLTYVAVETDSDRGFSVGVGIEPALFAEVRRKLRLPEFLHGVPLHVRAMEKGRALASG